jgi:type I restriction enzyme M protein
MKCAICRATRQPSLFYGTGIPACMQDIEGHLRGGIPERDLDAFAADWQPGVRQALFECAGRPGYARMKLPQAEVKSTVLGHPEFAAFTKKVNTLLDKWQQAITPRLMTCACATARVLAAAT